MGETSRASTHRERERTRGPDEPTDHHHQRQSRHAASKHGPEPGIRSFRDRIATVRDVPRTYAELIELEMDQYVVECAGCSLHSKNWAETGLENLKTARGRI